MKIKYTLLYVLLIAACLPMPSYARGGRGGRGGGFFTGWRKYKISSSSTTGRRVIKAQPFSTVMSMPKPKPPPPPPANTIAAPKPQMASYPRGHVGVSYTQSMAGAPVPAQGTFYPNAQALPAGAMYYPSSPMHATSGTGNFLTGMLAGHFMHSMLFGHRQNVAHTYHNNPQVDPQGQSHGREIVVINNGARQYTEQQQTTSSEAETDLSVESLEEPHTVEQEEEQRAPHGIICFPVLLKETNPEDPEQTHEVERIACYAAPTEPHLLEGCQMRNVTEPDAQDPNKMVTVQQLDCSEAAVQSISTTTTEPPIVAGDITGSVAFHDVAAPHD